jgi:hypothetical protein
VLLAFDLTGSFTAKISGRLVIGSTSRRQVSHTSPRRLHRLINCIKQRRKIAAVLQPAEEFLSDWPGNTRTCFTVTPHSRGAWHLYPRSVLTISSTAAQYLIIHAIHPHSQSSTYHNPNKQITPPTPFRNKLTRIPESHMPLHDSETALHPPVQQDKHSTQPPNKPTKQPPRHSLPSSGKRRLSPLCDKTGMSRNLRP